MTATVSSLRPKAKANLLYFEALLRVRKRYDEDSNDHVRGKIARVDMCLDSLSKYPLPLPSLKHCQILRGFNKEMVGILEEECKPQVAKRPARLNTDMHPPNTTTATQEEADFQFAVRLSQELNVEAEEDYHVALHLHSQNYKSAPPDEGKASKHRVKICDVFPDLDEESDAT